MADFEVRGVDDFRRLAAKLKTADKPLRLKLGRELRAAMKPTVEAIRESASRELPKAGGLAKEVAASKIGVAIRKTGNDPSVRVQAKSRHAIGAMNRGRLRHPTFGHDPWVTQAIKPNWWTDPTKKAAPAARAAAQRALDELAKELD